MFAHNYALSAWADLYINNSSGTAGMVVQGEGNVGIGTATPGAPLHVANGKFLIGTGAESLSDSQQAFEITPAASNATFLLNRPSTSYFSSSDWITGGNISTGWSMQIPASQTYLQILDRVNDLPRMVLTNTGNVGIGTTSPLAKLDVNGTASVSGALTLYGTPTIATTAMQTLTLGNASTGNIILAPTTGNVGIGTTSPGTKLEIYGSNPYFRINSNAGQGTLDIMADAIFKNGSLYISKAPGDDWMRFATTPDVQFIAPVKVGTAFDTMNIVLNTNGSATFAGNVGIGTTSPVGKLHVEGAVVGKALGIFNETGDQAPFTASVSGVTKFTIANNGNVTVVGSGTTCVIGSGTGATNCFRY